MAKWPWQDTKDIFAPNAHLQLEKFLLGWGWGAGGLGLGALGWTGLVLFETLQNPARLVYGSAALVASLRPLPLPLPFREESPSDKNNKMRNPGRSLTATTNRRGAEYTAPDSSLPRMEAVPLT